MATYVIDPETKKIVKSTGDMPGETAIEEQCLESHLLPPQVDRHLRFWKDLAAELENDNITLETILENVAAGVAHFDRSLRFIKVNSLFAAIVGRPASELVGCDCADFFPQAAGKAILEDARDSGQPVTYRSRLWTMPDGSGRGKAYWDWTVIPVKDRQGQVDGLVLSITDVTEHKKTEQSKDEFIGLVSHELRSPLTVVMGAINTALAEQDQLSRDEMHQLLQDAALEAEELSNLLANLLELSRAQANRLELSLEPVCLEPVIHNSIDKVKWQCLPTHRFDIDLPEDLPLVAADELRLERILYNLLENSIKYSPEGGRIRVSAGVQESRVTVSVVDQGIGISTEDQARLFSPFERLEENNLDGIDGLGLGLLVCRRLVEAHGGQIWVESVPGNGATFSFTLKIQD